MILAFFMAIFKRPISDGYFTLISAWAIFVFSALLITRIWRNHLAQTPVWLIAASLMLTGMIYPVLWGVNSARIYEAATLTCTAFVLAGLFFIFDTLAGYKPNRISLFFAGVFWGFAIGSRMLSVIVIFILCLGVLWKLAWPGKQFRLSRSGILDGLALILPIGIALLFLGWYNFIRFGNPFDSGLRFADDRG